MTVAPARGAVYPSLIVRVKRGVAGKQGASGEVSVKSLEYRPKGGLPAGRQG